MRDCWHNLGVFYFIFLSVLKVSNSREVDKIVKKQKLKYHRCERAYIESGKTYDELACSWQFEGVRYHFVVRNTTII